jgi:hypothetical protein
MGDLGVDGKTILRTNLNERSCEGADLIEMTQDRDQ